MKTHLFALVAAITISYSASSQMRNIYRDVNANNEIRNFSFYQPNEGFIAFDQWLGYTVDSGHTFVRKYVTTGNVDYNGYSVNLTFGFDINGVYAFNKDTLLLYGDYGDRASILYSTNGGTNFKLVNHQYGGTFKKIFFTDSNTGFAQGEVTVWKSTDKGKNWTPIVNLNTIVDLKYFGNNLIIALLPNLISKSVNGGTNWTNMPIPSGGTAKSFDLVDANRIYLITSANFGTIYYSSNGGTTWVGRNSPSIYEVNSSDLKFINDTTGYFVDTAFNILKTTDGGTIWEKLPRDSSFSYLSYTLNDLYFYNNQQFWAGGAYGYLEFTNNGGGTTMPNAKFMIDISQLRNNGTVKLTNYSKQGSAYSYKWYKNNVLISTTYNTSYFSNQNYIDTISLIVAKNGVTDTLTKIVDTRANVQPCVANFTVTQSDTSRVAFTSTYQDIGRTHFWFFGDGTADSSSVNPVHFYNATGTYIVKHRIYNTISRCTDSATTTITIYRVQACLKLDFLAVTDNFFTNKIYFYGRYDTSLENNPNPASTPANNWNFGNGTIVSRGFEATNTYANSGIYNVCFSLKNNYTGCVSQVCKPVTIVLDSCSADFIVNPNIPAGLDVSYFRFEGKKLNTDSGKAHYWIINNRDTIGTGNRNYLEKDFYKRGTDAEYFNWYVSGQSNLCNVPYTREINLDSLSKKVRHIVIDSISGCTTTSSEKTITVPTRIKAIQINAVPDPEVPNLVTFYATHLPAGSITSWPYYSVWRKNYTSFSSSYYSYGGDQILMAYAAPGTYNYAVAANTCPSDNTREIYSINYKVTSLDSCGIKKPQLSYMPVAGNAYKVQFIDTVDLQNHILNGYNELAKIYFGNGDSSIFRSHMVYTYPQPGLYNCIVKIRSQRTGCVKTASILVNVRCPNPSFNIQKDSLIPRRIAFTNKTTLDTATVVYLWRFGNGDSSSLKNPVYTYPNPGVYTVSLQAFFANGCNLKYDSTIVISSQPCNIGNVFKDSAYVIVCDDEFANLSSLYNTTGYTVFWNVANPLQVRLGKYRMLAVDSNFCADTASVRIVQDTAIFKGGSNLEFASTDWHNPANWMNNKLPTAKSHVIIKRMCILSTTDVSVASLQVLRYYTLKVLNNRRITITSNCPRLPYVSEY